MAERESPTPGSALAIVEEAGPAAIGRAAPPPAPRLPGAAQVADLLAYGRVVAESGLFPNATSPQAAVVIMRFGQQLGIDEFTALSEIYWINRVPVCSAKLMTALIARDHGGDAILPVESTPARCTISYKRRDWAERKTSTVGIEQYKHLLGKDNWRNAPADMLWARNVSRIARQSFADTIKGLRTREEVRDAGEAEADGDGDRVGAMRRLHAIAAARGLNHDALHRMAVDTGVASLADLDAPDLLRMGDELEDLPAEAAAPEEPVDVAGEEPHHPPPIPDYYRVRSAGPGAAVVAATTQAIARHAERLGLAPADLDALAAAEWGAPDAAALSPAEAAELAALLGWARQIDGARVPSRLEKILADLQADTAAERLLGSRWLTERFSAKEADLATKAGGQHES